MTAFVQQELLPLRASRRRLRSRWASSCSGFRHLRRTFGRGMADRLGSTRARCCSSPAARRTWWRGVADNRFAMLLPSTPSAGLRLAAVAAGGRGFERARFQAARPDRPHRGVHRARGASGRARERAAAPRGSVQAPSAARPGADPRAEPPARTGRPRPRCLEAASSARPGPRGGPLRRGVRGASRSRDRAMTRGLRRVTATTLRPTAGDERSPSARHRRGCASSVTGAAQRLHRPRPPPRPSPLPAPSGPRGSARDPGDAHHRLLLPRVVVEAQVTHGHRPQVVRRLEIPDPRPLGAAIGLEASEGVGRWFALDQPVGRHGSGAH